MKTIFSVIIITVCLRINLALITKSKCGILVMFEAAVAPKEENIVDMPAMIFVFFVFQYETFHEWPCTRCTFL